ncbi:TetR/AcrR family transcriptional regulator [Acrocarpospora macrocephala]|uniref:TetR family transcriptional regulator n=1 Tax=Acrocarpospora macrocephala TaxID=150177 RepID=A0A5M3WLR3_9ACTN|nr:TetR family transcriptional regulator [Acrocarpospora macrocephala]GES09099.1 TetR family transcriptional regulator [Acrocarpospora macrocephala]
MTPKEKLLGEAIDYFATHGIGDASLRSIATGLGTSHRMLIYHFGSREGLLAEVVRAVEAQQRASLAMFTGDDDLTVAERSQRYWDGVVEATLTYGRLFFELSAHAMQKRPHTEGLRGDLIAVWLPPLTELFVSGGIDPAEAPAYARLSLAATRGLLFDLLLTGDREGVDEAIVLLNRFLQT